MAMISSTLHFLILYIILVHCGALNLQNGRGTNTNGDLLSRKNWIGKVASVPLAWNLLSDDAVAAEPIQSKETDSLFAMSKRSAEEATPVFGADDFWDAKFVMNASRGSISFTSLLSVLVDGPLFW